MKRLGGVKRGVVVGVAAAALAAGMVGIGGPGSSAVTAAGATTCSGTKSEVWFDHNSPSTPNDLINLWNPPTVLTGDHGTLATTATTKSVAAELMSPYTKTSGIVFFYKWANNTPGHYFNLTMQGFQPLNSYRKAAEGIQIDAASSSILAWDHTDHTSQAKLHAVGTIANGQAVTTAKQWVRVNVVGSTMQVRTWADGKSEPTTWHNFEVNTPQLGKPLLTLNDSSSAKTTDSFTIGNLAYYFPSTAPCPATTTTSTVPKPTTTAAPTTTTRPTTTTTIPASQLRHSETFTGTNGSPWSSNWTGASPSGTLDLHNNAGRLSLDGSMNGWVREQLTKEKNPPAKSADAVDAGVKFSYQWSSNGAADYLSVSLGSGGWLNGWGPSRGYRIQVASNHSGAHLILGNSMFTEDLGKSTDTRPPTTTKWWGALEVKGSRVRMHIWKDGEAEPTTWTTVTDSSQTQPKQLYVSLASGDQTYGAKSVTVDDISLYRT